MINYNVISTGSKGNATIINAAILIDCGVTFKAISEVCRQLQLVLLTHRHSDHFNQTTISRLARERPTLRWGVPEWLVWNVLKCDVKKDNIDVYSTDEIYSYGAFEIETFYLPHNVQNMGYKIFFNNGECMMYATDTNDVSHVNAPNYDLYLIEANYTEDEIKERIKAKLDAGEYIYEYAAMQNHLSKEKCDAWLLKNMGEHGEFIYMHGHE